MENICFYKVAQNLKKRMALYRKAFGISAHYIPKLFLNKESLHGIQMYRGLGGKS